MDELIKIIDRHTEGNYLIGKTAKEEMAKDILVSQQRELLAFRKWQKDNWKDVYMYSDEFMISEFKKANCA